MDVEDAKKTLRENSVKSIFRMQSESLSPGAKSLLRSLWKYENAMEATLQLITEQQNLPLLTDILIALYEFLQEDEEQKSIFDAILVCVSVNLSASNAKLDHRNLNFLKVATKLVMMFPQELKEWIKTAPSNPHLAALAILCVAKSSERDELIPLVLPILHPKLATTTPSYAILKLMTKHSECENFPTIKTVASFYKSCNDKTSVICMTPLVMRVFMTRMSPQMIKDMPPVIAFLSKKLKKNSEQVPLFCHFLEKYLDLSDAAASVRSYSEKILKLLLYNMNNEAPNEVIGDTFISVLEKMSLNPFKDFFMSYIESKPTEVLRTIIHMTKKLPKEYFTEDCANPIIDHILPTLQSLDTTYELVIEICNFFVRNFESKTALSVLIGALEKGSSAASDALLNNQLQFGFVFPKLSRTLKPGKSLPLVLETLRLYLQERFPETGSSTSASDTDAMSSSESNFDIPTISEIATDWDEMKDEVAPTDETVLFCTILVSLEKHHELFPLLPFAASALNAQFSQILMTSFPAPAKRRYQLNALSSFGNALDALDSSTISSLAHTLLMLLPDSMLFIGMTLQRLSHSLIMKCITKIMPFVLGSPDQVGRMIALISYAHPDIALSFIDMVLVSTPIKKRVFFVMKFSESGEQTLTVMFRTIGYCSIFLDIVYFMNSFLPFATTFLNKYLTHESKSLDLYKAALFAIRKLSCRVTQWQEEHEDHLFPFKDFLVQYVCSYYMDVGDTILATENIEKSSVIPMILFALTSLLPLRPVRICDRHERSVELTAVLMQVLDDAMFESVYKSAKMFFTTLLECNPSLNVFVQIMLPMFPALLLNRQWIQLCKLVHFVALQWNRIKIQGNSETLTKVINHIENLVSYVLPLVAHEDVSQVASEIVFALTSLQCAVRNHILSLPKSILPDISPSGEDLPREVCGFICKYFMASQVFDVVLALLNTLVEKKVLEVHQLGLCIVMKHLLREKGGEEFRFDGRIIQGLLAASISHEEVVAEFFEIFEILMRMRMFSVLSVFINQNENISDYALRVMMEKVLGIEGGAHQLFTVIIGSLTSDENEPSRAFCMRALPMMSDSIRCLNDEEWAKLVSSVSNHVSDVQNPVFKVLAGNNPCENSAQFAKSTAESRLISLPLILAELPFPATPFHVELALAFAAASEESCSSFLEYAATGLRAKIYNYDLFAIMTQTFENISFEFWKSVAEDLTGLFIQSIRCDQRVLDCCIHFVNKLDEESLGFFWSSLVQIVSANIEKWTDILTELSIKSRISYDSFAELIPHLVVRPACSDLVKSIARGLSLDDTQDDHQIASAIMKSQQFHSRIPEFMDVFVSMLDNDLYAPHCYAMIESVCDCVTDENTHVVQALIGRLASHDISSTLLRVLR